MEFRGVVLFIFGTTDNVDIDTFEPADPHHFGLSAQVFISEPGHEGADSFDMVICTSLLVRGQDIHQRGMGAPEVLPDGPVLG